MPTSTSARATFQHVWTEVKAVVLLLAIAAIVVYIVDDRVSQLRGDINTVVRVACLSNHPPTALDKYNDQLRVQIDANLQAEALNTTQGLAAKAALNASTAARLRADLISAPKQNCYKPLLP